MAEESVKKSDPAQVHELSGVLPSQTTQESTSTPETEEDMAKKSGKRGGKSTTAKSRPVSAGEDHTASPTLVVEKVVDTEAGHGEEAETKAPVAEKNAYVRRALDAEPDLAPVRKQTSTPDIAAEVADTAATLDQDPPTPPISDEEAGRIGLRRMSATPIPQVAKTAAEVADVAATLDVDEPEVESPHRFPGLEDDDGMIPPCDSCQSTPPNEKVPKFSHETFGLRPPKKEGPCTHEPLEPVGRPKPLTPGYEEAVDISDPNVEALPTTREEIIERLRRLSEHLPEDVTNVDIAPPSPVIDPNYPPQELEEPPVAHIAIHEVVQPLHTISEERHAPEPSHSFLPVTPSVETVSTPVAPVSSVESESVAKDEPVVEETAASDESKIENIPKTEETEAVEPVQEEPAGSDTPIETKPEEEAIAKDEPKVEEPHWVAAAIPLQYVEATPNKEATEESSKPAKDVATESAPLATVEAKETDEAIFKEEPAAAEPGYLPIPQTEDEGNVSSSSEEELPAESVEPAQLSEIVEESSSEEGRSVPQAIPAQIRYPVEESSSEEQSAVEEEKPEVLAETLVEESKPEDKSLVEEAEPIIAVSAAVETSQEELPIAKDEPAPTSMASEIEPAVEVKPEEPSAIEDVTPATTSKDLTEVETTPTEESTVKEIQLEDDHLEAETLKLVDVVETPAEETSEAESTIRDAEPAVFTPTEDSNSKEEQASAEPESVSALETQVQVETGSEEDSSIEAPKVLVVTNTKAEESTPSVDLVNDPAPVSKVEAEEESSSEEESDIETAGSVATSAQPESKSEAEEKEALTKEPEATLSKELTSSKPIETVPEVVSKDLEQEVAPSIDPVEQILPADEAQEIEEIETHTPMPETTIQETSIPETAIPVPVSLISEIKPEAEATQPPTLVEDDSTTIIPVAAPAQEIINETRDVEPVSIPAPAPADISKGDFVAINPETVHQINTVSIPEVESLELKQPEADPIATQKVEEAALIPITPEVEVAAVEKPSSFVAHEKSAVPEVAPEQLVLDEPAESKELEENVWSQTPEVEVQERTSATADDLLTKEIEPTPEESKAIEEAEPAVVSEEVVTKDIVTEPTESLIAAIESAVTSEDLPSKEVEPTPEESTTIEEAEPAIASEEPVAKDIVSEPTESAVATDDLLSEAVIPESKDIITEPEATPTESAVAAIDLPSEAFVTESKEIDLLETAEPAEEHAAIPISAQVEGILPEPEQLEVPEPKEISEDAAIVPGPEQTEATPIESATIILDSVQDTPIPKTAEIVIEEPGTTTSEDKNLSTSEDAPVIEVLPATPAQSILPKEADEAKEAPEATTLSSEDQSKSIEAEEPIKATETEDAKPASDDTAKSTAFEGGDSTELKSRKLQADTPPTPLERTLTPSSMKSITAAAGKQAKDGNFLKAFWRAVFVDWLGGLLVRLCGGNKDRNALWAVGTIAAIAIAPVVAFFMR
jgi:hypothetical protein